MTGMIQLIATVLRVVLGGFGVICFIDGLVTLYARYALNMPSQRFILHIMHDQQWLKLIIGIACVAASLIIRIVTETLKPKGGQTLPPGKTS